MKRPLIVHYLNLLHKYRDPNALKVRNFVKVHVDDEDFIRRASVIRTIFRMSQVEAERVYEKSLENIGKA